MFVEQINTDLDLRITLTWSEMQAIYSSIMGGDDSSELGQFLGALEKHGAVYDG